MNKFELLEGDCLEILPELAGNFAIVSDPPYGMNNNTDYSRFTMGPRGHGKASSRSYPKIVGDDSQFNPSPFLHYQYVSLWGWNHFASKLPVGTTLIWIKRFPHAFGSFLSDAELAWMKGGHGVYCFQDTSMFANTNDRLHPTQKPLPLMQWNIQKMKIPHEYTIIDPYAGSGTTGEAAIIMGYPFIGIEIVNEYYLQAKERLERAARQPTLLDMGGLTLHAADKGNGPVQNDLFSTGNNPVSSDGTSPAPCG